MENKTAVEWYFDKIKSHFEHDGDLFETATFTYSIAKLKEKEQLEKAIEFSAEGMYSRKYLVDFVYFLNDRHFNKYTVDTDEVDLFIEQFKKK